MKRNISEEKKKVDCSQCNGPDQCRVCMYQSLIKPSEKNNNKPYFEGTFDSFLSQKFGNGTSLREFYNFLAGKNFYRLTFNDFIKKYACDLVNKTSDENVWGKETLETCKSTLPPEPPKKLSQVEIIQQYHDAGIHPFTKGKVVELKNKLGFGYYEKQGTSRGMEGTFQFYAPNKEGVAHYGFYIDGENIFNGITKVTNVIHESKLRRKNLSEKYDKDSKVLHLLKEISRINKEKKKFDY